MTSHLLIGYDITSPKRLGKLFRRLKQYGIPIQYSLFLCDLTRTRLGDCIIMIESIIDPATDDVRIYPLPENLWSFRMGRAVFPEGIFHTGLPSILQSFPDERNSKPYLGIPPVETEKPVRYDATARKMIATCQTGQKKGIFYIP